MSKKYVDDFNNNEEDKYETKKLNLARSSRIIKNYIVDEKLKHELLIINQPQTWLVITEDWCGDSAQNLPYIASMIKLNSLINLKILLRDKNLDIMDLYLTNGTSRSIPKLVAFDFIEEEIFQWGPRPEEAAHLIEESIKSGLSKDEYTIKLHSWYSFNKGKAIESEFFKILTNYNLAN
jgi:hypothetical protein